MARSVTTILLTALATCLFVAIEPLPAAATSLYCDFKRGGEFLLRLRVVMQSDGTWEDEGLVALEGHEELLVLRIEEAPLEGAEFFHFVAGPNLPGYSLDVRVYMPEDDREERWPAMMTTPKIEEHLHGECGFREL